jgi:hypothetical protein
MGTGMSHRLDPGADRHADRPPSGTTSIRRPRSQSWRRCPRLHQGPPGNVGGPLVRRVVGPVEPGHLRADSQGRAEGTPARTWSTYPPPPDEPGCPQSPHRPQPRSRSVEALHNPAGSRKAGWNRNVATNPTTSGSGPVWLPRLPQARQLPAAQAHRLNHGIVPGSDIRRLVPTRGRDSDRPRRAGRVARA